MYWYGTRDERKMKPCYLISTAASALSMFATSASGQAQPEGPFTLTGEELMQARGAFLKDFARSPSVTAANSVSPALIF